MPHIYFLYLPIYLIDKSTINQAAQTTQVLMEYII